MKRLFVSVAVLAAAVCAAAAQPIDKTVATVRLTRPQVITVLQLRRQVDPLEAQARRPLSKDERKLVLDGLVARALIEQAAERDRIVVSALTR